MLIFIISFVLLVVGILLFAFSERIERKFCIDEDAVGITGVCVTLVFGFAVLAICGCFIGAATRATYDYEVLEAERVSLELRIDKMDEYPETAIVEANSLYRDVYEYNMKVKKQKYWGGNLWTNWFYGRKVVKDSKYIELTT